MLAQFFFNFNISANPCLVGIWPGDNVFLSDENVFSSSPESQLTDFDNVSFRVNVDDAHKAAEDLPETQQGERATYAQADSSGCLCRRQIFLH